jgi:hypothetical protein
VSCIESGAQTKNSSSSLVRTRSYSRGSVRRPRVRVSRRYSLHISLQMHWCHSHSSFCSWHFSSSLIHNPPSSLLELVDCYNFTRSNLLNKHAPLKIKAVYSRPSKPWFTPHLHAWHTECMSMPTCSKNFYVVNCKEFGLVLILPLILNVSVLQRIGIMLLSLKPNALFMLQLFLLLCL